MTKLEWALAHARKGLNVFPLADNAKNPRDGFTNWAYQSTTDEARITEWWTKWPDANIAIYAGGLLICDIDPRKGGANTFATLGLSETFPGTLIANTAGGGLHLYYALPKGVLVTGGNDKLGQGIDLKTHGGYVVAPGSAINGKQYTWKSDRPIVQVAQWIVDHCKTARPKSEAAGKRLVEEDAEAIKRATDWMAKHAPDASEGSRDDEAFKVAARLYDYGVSKETARELLAEWAFNHTFPPMDEADIARVAESAGRNRSNAVGSKHSGASGFEPVEIAPRETSTLTLAGTLTIPAHVAAAMALSNPARPLVKGLLDRGTLSVLYGAPGSGKSFGGMDLGYHIGRGLPWAGMKVHRGQVILVAAEGGEGVYARLAALQKHYGQLDDSLLHIVTRAPDLLHGQGDADAIIKEIKRLEEVNPLKVELVIIDTIARVLAGGDENSGQDMGALIKNLDHIRVAGETHVMGVHHTGKDKARGARGHSSLLGAVDTEIEADNHILTVTKQRDMGKETRVAFHLRPIKIGVDQDGDEVVSCYVEIRPKGDFDVPLSGAAQAVLDALWAGVEDSKRPITEPFDMSFVVECVANSGAVLSREPKALRHHMTELDSKRTALKVKNNQWVLVDRKRTEEDRIKQR